MDKFKLKKFTIYVQYKNQWVDVSGKKAIIYGAGQGCLDMLNTLELPNVQRIVDGNKKVQDTDILIQNRLFTIESPEILKNIDWNEHYIVVSSSLYGAEILENIKKLVAEDAIACVWDTDIFYCYENIEDMVCLDPVFKRKVLDRGLSFEVYHILNRFYEICEQHFKDTTINRFIPMLKGAGKLVFLFGNEERLWVYSIRGKENSRNMGYTIKNEEKLFKKKYSFLEKQNVDKEITIYRDADGILVQKYADNQIDFFDDKIRKKVLQECRRIHQINPSGLEDNRLVADWYNYYKEQSSKIDVEDQELFDLLFKIMDENIKIFNSSKIKKVIHGDLNIDNLVIYNDKIIFIDWEFLSVGNPMFDLGYFLFCIYYKEFFKNKISFYDVCEACFSELPQLLQEYCEDEEEISVYQESAKAGLNIILISYSLERYFLAKKQDGLQQIKEFVSFYNKL